MLTNVIPLPQLEICAETPQACSAAFEGGAHRVEICTALDEGGVTPSHGLIQAAISAADGLPVYVLLRPRAGNFVYSAEEFETICADLEHAATLGVAGFVTGMLTEERTVDEPRMRELMKLAGDKEVTFHRAFDHTKNLNEALEQVISIGCRRLLTSGGKPTALEGATAIAQLAQKAGNRLRIAAGGAVTPKIAVEVRRVAKVDLHASLRKKKKTMASSDPLWDSANESMTISVDDVREMASVLSRF